jgi:hypothetical protein
VFRRFLIVVLIFLIAVVIVGDRVGALVGAHVLAGKVQTDEHLPNRPSASIGGIPFLTQAIDGKYKDVTITAQEVPVNQVQVTTLTAHLKGVHLPLSKVIGGSVSQVPVDQVTGTAFVSYADANSYLAKHRLGGQLIRLSSGGGATLDVLDKAKVAGQKVSLRGSGTLAVKGNVVSVAVASLSGSKAAASLVSAVLKKLNISFPLTGLPFRLQLSSVSVTTAGLTGSGGASHIVLGSH